MNTEQIKHLKKLNAGANEYYKCCKVLNQIELEIKQLEGRRAIITKKRDKASRTTMGLARLEII